MTNTPFYITPDKFKAMRLALGLTQSQAAVLLGIPGGNPVQVCNWEAGRVRIPHRAVIIYDLMSKLNDHKKLICDLLYKLREKNHESA